MDLLRMVYRDFRWPFLGVFVLNIVSAGLGIGVIAFINQKLIGKIDAIGTVSLQFLGLILILLAVTLGAQLALTTLGHYFVFHLRSQLVKRILDTCLQQVEQITRAQLLTSLNSDVRNITLGFVRLPELLQGIILTLASTAYLAWLSPKMLLPSVIWVAITLIGGGKLVSRVYRHLAKVRATEDDLQADYQAVIDGHKELTLNRDRAKKLYHDHYLTHANDYRQQIIRADTYHLSAVNWSNIMMLGAIGLVFFLANGLGWGDTGIAATYSLTLLFLRTPLLGTVGALPMLLSAQVSFNKLRELALPDYQPDFHPTAATSNLARNWQTLSLHDVTFQYPAASGTSSFGIGPLNLTIRRGELIFLIGGNGSGKSTLARLLTGLNTPDEGTILLDETPITTTNRAHYQQHFSAVFTDFHLFGELLGPQGQTPDPALINHWLQQLQMQEKLRFNGNTVTSLQLSQGQRKRLAMLLAVAEDRDILLLDEWAADQDPLFRRYFYLDLLPQLQAMGKTIVAISHDDHYFNKADRLLEMRHGQLLELTGQARTDATLDAVAVLAAAAH